jgi:phosphorylcholine metabolism protein LicD
MEKLVGKDPLPVLLAATDNLTGHWWLTGGTLLGFVRDGSFIPSDTDLDIGMIGNFDRDSLPKDFRPIRFLQDGDKQLQSAYIHEPTQIIFDITHNHPDGADYYTESDRGRLTRPRYLLDELDALDIFGHTFPIPKNTDAYLTRLYGDWRTPVEDGKTEWVK